MSNSKTIPFTCPHCGKNYEVEVWESIHAEQDEDLRDRCVSGDLFRQSCPHCKKEYLVQYPLVYMDQVHRFVIWLSEKVPPEEMMRRVAAPLAPMGYVLRRASTLYEFAEKIQVLEDGVDDRAVELAKYDSMIEFINNKKGTAEDITAVEYQKTENGVMKINIRTDDKGLSFLIPVELVEAEIAEKGSFYDVDNRMFPLVNADWIIQLFEQENDQPNGVLN